MNISKKKLLGLVALTFIYFYLAVLGFLSFFAGSTNNHGNFQVTYGDRILGAVEFAIAIVGLVFVFRRLKSSKK